MNEQRNPHAMYRYYGAPAVAFREGGLVEHYLGAGEASQAPAVSAGTGALTAYDLVSALASSYPKRDTQVAAAKAPNGMPPAAAATVMHHAELNAHFGHPLPRNTPRKFVKEIPKVAAAKAPNGMPPAAAATVMHHAELNAHFGHPLPRNTPRKFVKKIPKVVQPPICEVCKIQLASKGDLKTHETGKKHKKNLEKLQDSITPIQENPPNGAVGTSTAPAAAVADGVMSAVQPKKNKRSAGTPEDLEMKKRRVLEAGAAQGELKICTMSNVIKKIPKVVQPVTCEVCKIQCNTLGDLRTHEIGKKHKQNLEKLQDSITSEPAKPPNGAVGATTEPVAVAAAAVADGVIPAYLEVKKRRLIEFGAAQDQLKVCTMCNVVSHIQKNYDSHIAGHKHKAKLQKQQQAQLTHVA